MNRKLSEEIPSELAAALRLELFRIARFEDELAATEAAAVPYWVPCPPSVQGHRAAAQALRAEADALVAA
jgi:hypothetical protein